MLIGLKQKDLKNKLEQKLDELYEIRKNTVYINGTGNYGDNYKKRLIKSFNLDKKFANIVMSLSYGI